MDCPVIIARLDNEVIKALRALGTVKRLVDDGSNEIIGSKSKRFCCANTKRIKDVCKMITGCQNPSRVKRAIHPWQFLIAVSWLRFEYQLMWRNFSQG